MTMELNKQTVLETVEAKNGKRGFTLTEIAIVLGIIGLILGSIWVAAAAVYSNLRLSKSSTQLLTIVQNVRRMYATSNVVDSAATMTLAQTQTAAGLVYIRAGVFPSDMLNDVPASAITVSDSWNGYVAITPATSSLANDSFSVQFSNVPPAACINMLTQTTGTGRDPGLIAAAAADTATTAVTVFGLTPPISAAAAATACNTTTVNKIVAFEFKLK